MSEAVVDDIVAVLPPLLQSLEALGFIARHLNPPDFEAVMEAAGTPDQALRNVGMRLADWPEEFAGIQTSLKAASHEALAAFEELRAVQNGRGDLTAVFRALRHAPRAQEARGGCHEEREEERDDRVHHDGAQGPKPEDEGGIQVEQPDDDQHRDDDGPERDSPAARAARELGPPRVSRLVRHRTSLAAFARPGRDPR